MPIELDIEDTQPGLNRNLTFMCEMHVEQVFLPRDDDPPVYKVSILWRRYGVDASGVRHPVAGCNEEYLPNYLVAATEAAQDGDMRMINALEGIKNGLAAIIERNTGITTKVT